MHLPSKTVHIYIYLIEAKKQGWSGRQWNAVKDITQNPSSAIIKDLSDVLLTEKCGVIPMSV